ncbi:phage portal protein [Acidocella sp. KAb 2-4]|uniref:phage portal protein n=1 Tax=Acidocella sp. KAb 2-4 TaxID=2885158 RepID=UPI001D09341F|nr:phage portal protein [Acidocella sp. KAb 2-4]MCB5944130.1 phage portal protein [Acidocella sp. KAb 2-4]
MFETICGTIQADTSLPPRVAKLDILRRVLDGTLYDNLPYQFHEERNTAGEYIPLRLRRPSVRYGLCRVVVEDSVALLFSAGHFPAIDADDPALVRCLQDVIAETRLNEVMIDAAIKGSVGSVALLFRVLQGRVFFSALESLYLTPVWSAVAPDTLERVSERYKVSGADLAAQGYENIDPQGMYWFQRIWDAEAETWYLPWAVNDPLGGPVKDEQRSVTHGLGFVPVVWIRNLPGGEGVDGACTFRTAIDTNIEIDYQLSQAGRGLKYSSDPTLLIKEPATSDTEIVKGAGNALVVSEKGDAKLLEIGGTAAEAVISYVRTLREFALESVHGNRASADRLTAAQSGRALELMNQGLIWLADNLRIAYGEGGILPLLKMVVRASQIFPLVVMGQRVGALDGTQRLKLRWPRWYPLSADDRLKEAQAISTLVNAGQLSRETAVKSVAAAHGITDVEAELEAIDQDAQ